MTKTGHVGEQEARDVAEAARETEWQKPSFAKGLFAGEFRLELIHPVPRESEAQRRRGDEYIARLRRFVETEMDPDENVRLGRLPDRVVQGLRDLGAFGMNIPEEYGGLGLSQSSYQRAISMVTSRCGSAAAWLSAHQSIGVPKPLKMFGTEEQKRRYLPRLAAGEISAFALTEPNVGSDPARMETTAELSEDGMHWILNGQKLWCTNGPVADLLIVMAQTPPRTIRGKERRQISAFIVEGNTPGITIDHICRFMGLDAIQNCLMTFRDVRVPRENLLWDEGKGLKLALTTLNTGRLTLPASCLAGARVCLEIVRNWAKERQQWGAPIGHHEAIAAKIGDMAATTFAMEAIVELTGGMVDDGNYDIRLEAAMAKLFNSEAGWRIVDDTMQIRGGRGYETAESLQARGEAPIPTEKLMRDYRINTIFEGSSEIMHLFIAREAVDEHLRIAGALVDPRAPTGEKLRAGLRAGLHYAWWYPTRWIGWAGWPRYAEFGPLARHLRYAHRTARRLSRAVFHAMIANGARLEKRQALLGRFVEIGTELFLMSTACAHARDRISRNPSDRRPEELADLFCAGARQRIGERFRAARRNHDAQRYRVARRVLDGEHAWVEEGAVSILAHAARAAAAEPREPSPVS
ncbi:MAG: acyl-CoA dehydrogenase family protein [Acidobacteriota bacterium]|jgi:alkylation response protein AidB-like acyl-CoA dehydrogenase